MKVWFDLETGGLTPEQPILQISASIEGVCFDGYCNPVPADLIEMDDKAREMHYNRKYSGVKYPHERALIADFLAFIDTFKGEDRYLTPAGHNVAGFDLPFLKARAKVWGIKIRNLGYHCVDTMVSLMMFEDISGQYLLSKSLGNACKAFGIETKEGEALHNAKTDIRMTIDLYKAICSKLSYRDQ